MGKVLTNYFNKIFNSPKNYDDLSSKKTKNFLLLLCFLGIILWIIIIIVVVKDSLSRLTFMTNQIENQITIPSLSFIFLKNISQYAINLPPTQVIPSEVIFANGFYCQISGIDPKKENCTNQNLFPSYVEYIPIQNKIYINEFNLTFEKQYLNINIGQNLAKYNSSSTKDMTFTTFMVNINDYNFILTGPIDTQIMIKKTIRIDRYEKETINYIPSIFGAAEKSTTCPYYPDQGYGYKNCSTVSVSVVFESNIVSIYKEETNLQLFKRILKDIFSIGKLVLILMALIITYYQTKFLFKEETAWFDNNIRDAVLFHFNSWQLDPSDEEEKPPGCFGRLINKIKAPFLCCCCKPDPPKKLTRKEKMDKDTKGSSNPIVRLFQGVPNQDKYSGSIGLIYLIKLGLVVVGVIIYGVFIALQDYNNRLIISKLDNVGQLELPEIQFNYTGVNYWITQYEESLPGGLTKNCKINTQTYTIENCAYSSGFPGETLLFSGPKLNNILIKNDTIHLKDNQHYDFKIGSRVAILNSFPSFEYVHITLDLNGIEYYLRPFSNITIHLEKNVYHYTNGSTITSYNPRILQTQNVVNYYGPNGNYTTYYGETTVSFFYSSASIKHIFIEGNLDLGFRILSDIGAFYTPVNIVISMFFTYVVIRFANKYDTAHVEPFIREAILYHMKYYDKYSIKFRRPSNNNNN
ncbi:hypothetical protein ACTA71_000454 [Dictyostelium dimigraforme]